jgi:HD-GYP domain-containing protein (c-di-GMP phosphodiesterase class II)
MARVLGIVDSFDAMTSDRPYRAALPLDEAIRRLREGAGKQWDPDMVRVFVETVEDGSQARRASVRS